MGCQSEPLEPFFLCSWTKRTVNSRRQWPSDGGRHHALPLLHKGGQQAEGIPVAIVHSGLRQHCSLNSCETVPDLGTCPLYVGRSDILALGSLKTNIKAQGKSLCMKMSERPDPFSLGPHPTHRLKALMP
jgi:hypothetical protein